MPRRARSALRSPGRTLLVAAAASLAVAVPAQAAPSVYATAFFGGLTPIDTLTNLGGAPLGEVSFHPDAIAISPSAGTVFIGDPPFTRVLDLATGSTKNASSGCCRSDLAFAPDGTTVYVLKYDDSATPDVIRTLDAKTGESLDADLPLPVPADVVGPDFAAGATAVALTPDARTLVVAEGKLLRRETGDVERDDVVLVDVATRTFGARFPLTGRPVALAVMPDGRTAYAATDTSVTPLDLATATAGAPVTIPAGVRKIAIEPRTGALYALGATSVTPVDTATRSAGTAIGLGLSGAESARDIVLTPDGTAAYVQGYDEASSQGFVVRVALPSGTPLQRIAVPAGQALAITPDQPPVAAFDTTPSNAGSATAFNAAGSSDPDGSVAKYRWDFGDGSTATTGTPQTTHTYAAPGTYTARLTVTDDAGCSTEHVFTGHTSTCNGSVVATTSQQVTVAPAYVFGGFAAPINAGSLNVAKAGRTIPVKWHLEYGSGAPVSNPASFVGLTSTGGACGGTGTDAIETYTGNSGLQYLGGGDWQYNWAVPSAYAGQCRAMKLTLADGVHAQSFRFK